MKVRDYYTTREKPPFALTHFQLRKTNCCQDVNEKKGGGGLGKDSNMINAHEFLGHQENWPRICLFNLYSDLKN